MVMRSTNLNPIDRPLDDEEIATGHRKIYLYGRNGKGLFAWIDSDQYEKTCGYVWHLLINKDRRYVSADSVIGGKTKNVMLHRIVTDAARGTHVDHIDHNGLNNVRKNLRVCSPQENSFNQIRHGGTSKYKGVSRDKTGRGWVSSIMISHKTKFLGYFSSEEDAAREYDMAAQVFFGQYAYNNFPVDEYDMNGINEDRWKRNYSSKYRGVSYHKGHKSFVANLWVNKKAVFIGEFDDERIAAMAYDQKARELLGEDATLNFSNVVLSKDQIESRRRKHSSSSRFHGVHFDKSKKKWLVQIQVNNKTSFIGRFDNEVEAAIRYDLKYRELRRDEKNLNFPQITDYDDIESLIALLSA